MQVPQCSPESVEAELVVLQLNKHVHDNSDTLDSINVMV
jgi:hypothetical protein